MEALSQAARDIIVSEARSRESFRIAVSGGSTPVRTYQLLAEADLDWPNFHVWWVDDRFVPPTDKDSNEKLVRDIWLSKVSIPESNIHAMYKPVDPSEAARAYEQEWLAGLGNGGVDIAIMGVGPDGHTASLFPGDEAAFSSDRLILATKSPIGVAQRITTTPKALARCGTLLFLVDGTNKGNVREDLDGPGLLPGARIIRANPATQVYWVS